MVADEPGAGGRDRHRPADHPDQRRWRRSRSCSCAASCSASAPLRRVLAPVLAGAAGAGAARRRLPARQARRALGVRCTRARAARARDRPDHLPRSACCAPGSRARRSATCSSTCASPPSPARCATRSPARCATRRSSSPTGCRSTSAYVGAGRRAGRAARRRQRPRDDVRRARRRRASPRSSTTPRSETSRELVGAVTSAAGIALENERLQADLRARLSDLRASRARIVEAGDTARRKLERDLHDGAQQRLVSLSIVLRLVAGKLPPDAPETRAADQRPRGAHRLAGGAARHRARHPPRGPQRPRAAGRARVARRARAGARRACDVALDGAPAARSRGRRVLPRRRGPDQRRQVRRGAERDASTSRARTGRWWSRSPTTARAAPIPRTAPACAASPTASRRSTGACGSGARPPAAPRLQRGDPMRVVLADDTMLLREGVALLLGEAGFDVVGQAGNAEELVAQVGDRHARRRDRRPADAADAHRRGPAGGAGDPRAHPERRRARALPARRRRPGHEAAGRRRRGRRLPAQGPRRRPRGLRRRDPPRRRRRLGAGSRRSSRSCSRERRDGGPAGRPHARASARCSS